MAVDWVGIEIVDTGVPMTASYQAAWVPDPKTQWDEAARLAAEWTQRHCDEQNTKGILITGGGPLSAFPTAVGVFAERNEVTTLRSFARKRLSGGRPVLAYGANYRAVRLGARLASGSYLCVVEWAHPLRGWAEEVKAVNLAAGTTQEDTRDVRLRAQLPAILSYGHNGWTDKFSRARTMEILTSLYREDPLLLDRDAVIGFVLAHRVLDDDKDCEQLGRLIDSASLNDRL